MSPNETIVSDFIDAWSRRDVDEIVEFFSEDGIYHNMPIGPVKGHAALKDFIGGFVKDWTQTQWQTLTLIGRGDIVVAERIDRTTVAGKAVELPCCGVFEIKDGKIKVWRDYFDLATYMRPLQG